MKWVECVPNFSEGRDKGIIEGIAAAIRGTRGVTLLDVDPGVDTNRTVMTFMGEPEAVWEGAFAGIARAIERIDMQNHHGAHPRIGACDVCPFVPVQNVTMAECVELARRLGQRVAKELGIPIYLYEDAANRPERRNLAFVRKGEYEGLAEKLKDPEWKPDFGEPVFVPRSGATVIGAREFLIAYNFNLNTRDEKLANRIAWAIREAGKDGRPGKFQHVKAVGWYLDDFQRAQVSMNLTNYKKTPLALVFDEVSRLADELGVRCTGSELVGLIPKDCLLEAGRHYLQKAGKGAGFPEKVVLEAAIQSLGLADLTPFEVEKKVIEYRIEAKRRLISLTVQGFVDAVSLETPAPGGGSVAALCGALAAALSCMVGQLTIGKKGYEAHWEEMKALTERAQPLAAALLEAVDDDTSAFLEYCSAMRRPKATDEQKATREKSIQDATLKIIEVPLRVLRAVSQVVPLCAKAALLGNQNSLSDAAVACACARAAAEGAYLNVLINLSGLADRPLAAQQKAEAVSLRAAIRKTTELTLQQAEQKLQQ